jgi:capsular polysaccharide transport system permease protein
VKHQEIVRSPAIRRRSFRRAALGFAGAVLAPTLLAALYYGFWAADRYVAEIRYSVRSGAIMPPGEGGQAPLGGASALIFAGDSFVLADYIESAQAFLDIEARVPIREMLDRDGGDPVRGYDPALPIERLLPFWNAAVRPSYDAVRGITVVEVAMFAPEDADAVGRALVDELERIVDSLSADARAQTLRYVNAEFDRASAELEKSRLAIEEFRRANQIISPSEEVEIGAGIVATLSNQLAERRVELRTLRSRTPNSPRLPVLEREIAALEAQLVTEFERRAGDSGSALPGQLTSFDALENAYVIARDTYVSTLALKQEAEANATLGQAELVVFVPPRAPTFSTLPDRPVEVLKVFAVAFMIWLIVRILIASLRTE